MIKRKHIMLLLEWYDYRIHRGVAREDGPFPSMFTPASFESVCMASDQPHLPKAIPLRLLPG